MYIKKDRQHISMHSGISTSLPFLATVVAALFSSVTGSPIKVPRDLSTTSIPSYVLDYGK